MCRAIKDNPELAHIPLILLTTLSDSDDILKGLEARADFYLTKPFDETSPVTAR
jgi:CheY-like chemotaxis protein